MRWIQKEQGLVEFINLILIVCIVIHGPSFIFVSVVVSSWKYFMINVYKANDMYWKTAQLVSRDDLRSPKNLRVEEIDTSHIDTNTPQPSPRGASARHVFVSARLVSI